MWTGWSQTKEAKPLVREVKDTTSIILDGYYLLPKEGAYVDIKKAVTQEFNSGDFKLTTKILSLAEKISTECVVAAEKLSDPNFEDFSMAIDIMARLRFPWMACFPVADAAEEFIKKYAEEHNLSVSDVSAMVPKLPNSLNEDQKKLSLFKELMENKKDPHLINKLKDYQKETEYIGTHHFWGEERTFDRLIDAIKNSSPVVLEKADESKKIGKEFEILALTTKWRLECAQSSARLAYKFRPLLTKLASQHGLAYEDIIYLTTSEIEAMIEDKNNRLTAIRERQTAMGLIKEGERVRVVVGEEIKHLMAHFGLLDKPDEVTELRGAIGNKGIVRGVVAIVLKPTDNKKVKPGMILVAPETTPDFIPAMGKAAAFVTNQGGITSHAAIVAREMNKPCIIGTKNVTQVLKDGDLVEVDANKGVVRVIKKQTEEKKLIDKSLDYQKHQRDYSMLASTIVARGLFEENKKFFGVSPNPILLVIRDGVFYHFMSRQDAENRCRGWLKNNGLAELKQVDKEYGRKLKEFNKFRNEKRFDLETAFESAAKYLIDFSNIVFLGYELPECCGTEISEELNNYCLEIRNKYEDVHKRCFSALAEIVGQIEKRDKLARGSLLLLTQPEFEEYLKAKKLPEDLAERSRFLVVKCTEAGEEKFFDSSLWGELEAEEKIEAGELRGKSAYAGVVRGIVRVITKVEEAASLKSGEILVASMTDPRYLPAIKRSAAIVTDEGGITCHAAIVSRELKIPCIIATKNATQILKDGDLVEVDADKGVVKILEKEGGGSGVSFAGNDWKLTATRNMSFWHQCLSSDGHFHYLRDLGIAANLRLLAITADGTATSVFACEPNLGDYTKAVMEIVISERKMGVLKEKYLKIVNQVQKSLQTCLMDFTLNNWLAFLEDYKRFCPTLHPTTVIGRTGGERLITLLRQKGLAEELIPETIAKITYPEEHTPLFDSQIALLKIAAQVQKSGLEGPNLTKALIGWLAEYGHIPVNFCEEPWTLANAEAQLKSFLDKDCREELRRAEEGHKRRITEAKQRLKELDDKEISVIARAIAEGTYLNEFRKNAFSRVSLAFRPLFAEIARRAGSSDWREVFFLTPEESTMVVKGEEIKLKELVASRKIAGSYVDGSGNKYLLAQDIVQRFYRNIESSHGAGSRNDEVGIERVIKGFSANKGIVTGVVKIIFSSKDFYKLNSGDILVTTMTSVDFVPIMERAAAFVTNEGGITSHASIVAREMNKPCIIGTKNATKVLKDGDLVEVDANTGIVKIIK